MSRRRGQSTVELAIMMPVILMGLFVVVDLAFFFGGTHYTHYAAFVGARAQQVGEDADEASSMLMDGGTTYRARTRSGLAEDSVRIDMPWSLGLPFLSSFGNLNYDITAVAGPEEALYENRTNRGQRYGDNQCRGRC